MTVRISFFSLTARILAVAFMAASPVVSEAAGLGRLSVLSSLGQPLNAEVEIISLQPGEEEGLSARLAPMEAFKQAGIDFNTALLSVKFAIEQRNGKPVLKIASGLAINEPFLDLLVELQWNAGRLVREYTFLLDPPQFSAAAPAQVVPVQPQIAPAVPAVVRPVAAPAARVPESAPAVAPAPAVSSATYQVQRGDTLAGVARKNLPQGASFNQMLVALFRANGDAFDGGNINRLRAGRILSLPGADAVTGVNKDEARKFVESQAGEFAQYRRRLAGAVSAAPGSEAGAARSASGAITATPTKSAPSAPKDEVKLSKADPAKPAAQAAAKGDDKVASGRAIKEAQSRAQELEKTVTDLQKVLDLKSKQLAELEAKAPKSASQPVAAPAAPAAKPAPMPEPPKAVPVPAVPASAATPVDAAKAEPAKAVEPKPAPETSKPVPAKPTVKAAPPPPPATSFVDELQENGAAIGGAGVVAILLGAYGAWAWRRKKKAAAAVLGDAVTPGPTVAVAAPAANPAVAAQVEAAIASANLAPQESDEVDPVAEADVYMAYGRDAQAEEILKEALQKDPARVPVLAKMVEIYAQRRDAKGVEEYALKIKSATGGEGAEWEKAAALGQSVDPDNGLYSGVAGAGAAVVTSAASPALDFDLDGSTAAPEAPVADVVARTPDVVLDFDLGAPEAESSGAATEFSPDKTVVVDPTKAEGGDGLGLDFDLGEPEPRAEVATESAPAAVAGDGGLDFDLGTDSLDAPAPQATTDAALPELSMSSGDDKGLDFEPSGKASPATDNASVDFDLNLDLGSSAGSESQVDAPSIDLGSISLDLDAPGGSGTVDPKWQNASDKLDLAKAFEEMNDKSGARDLLNEVLRDGDAAQKQQAQEMLARLG